jgi:hypothetical protein
MKDFFKRNKSTLLDLLIVAVVTTAAIVLYMSFKDALKSLTGLASIAAYAVTQFAVAGLGPLIVMLIRKERFSSYGYVKKNTALSLAIGLVSIFFFVLLSYLIQGTVQWGPLRRISVTATAAGLPMPLNLAGLLLIATSWGFFEGFTLIFASKKVNALAKTQNPFLKPGPIVIIAVNFIVHLLTDHTLDASWILAALVTYAVVIIPETTKNSWGSALLFFGIWNAV